MGEQARDDHGRFASGGGAEHVSAMRRLGRMAGKAAHALSAMAHTRGEHKEAAAAHGKAAEAHHAAAAAHKEAAGKSADHAAKSEHEAQANHHEAQAKGHEQKKGEHGEAARTAPEKKGASAWIAKRLEGLGESLKEGKEKVAEAGERVNEAAEAALEGDPLKFAAGGLKRATEGRMGGAVAGGTHRALGLLSGGGEHGHGEHEGGHGGGEHHRPEHAGHGGLTKKSKDEADDITDALERATK